MGCQARYSHAGPVTLGFGILARLVTIFSLSSFLAPETSSSSGVDAVVLVTSPHRRPLAHVLLLHSELPGRVLLLHASDGRWQVGSCVSAKETGFNEVYVFVYIYNWVQVISIRILWHSCGKRRIITIRFKISE